MATPSYCAQYTFITTIAPSRAKSKRIARLKNAARYDRKPHAKGWHLNPIPNPA